MTVPDLPPDAWVGVSVHPMGWPGFVRIRVATGGKTKLTPAEVITVLREAADGIMENPGTLERLDD